MGSSFGEVQRYSFSVRRNSPNESTTLMSGDILKFSVQVFLNNTTSPTLLLSSPFQSVTCDSFFQGTEFLKTMLSPIHPFIQCIEEMTQDITSSVEQLFQLDGAPLLTSASEHREIPLSLEITLFHSRFITAIQQHSTEECCNLLPASDQVIRASLKKSTVVPENESCPICMEFFHVNDQCSSMPCHHFFHPHCILRWLRINHVCPMCRYSLPPLKN
ncbi:hypothetical protein VNO78_08548 [Psophocarpus tetragonolobus]|uniref:RING-type E3 ubiquitin transferase n=1 Tax=Psophocarpus tetragonolobus TaxID=3891 RepID=A0AAN9XSQ1_PSOTE